MFKYNLSIPQQLPWGVGLALAYVGDFRHGLGHGIA
jgi:hypothetical protein